jgi:hypothetical protein
MVAVRWFSIMMSLAREPGPVEDAGVAVFTFLPAGIGFPDPKVKIRPVDRQAGGLRKPA